MFNEGSLSTGERVFIRIKRTEEGNYSQLTFIVQSQLEKGVKYFQSYQ